MSGRAPSLEQPRSAGRPAALVAAFVSPPVVSAADVSVGQAPRGRRLTEDYSAGLPACRSICICRVRSCTRVMRLDIIDARAGGRVYPALETSAPEKLAAASSRACGWFRRSARRRQCAGKPLRDHRGDLPVVLLVHHHVAVALDAEGGEPHEGRVCPRLPQILDGAVVVG